MNEWMLTKRKNNFRHRSGLWQWHGRITAFCYPIFIQNSNLKAVLFCFLKLLCSVPCTWEDSVIICLCTLSQFVPQGSMNFVFILLECTSILGELTAHFQEGSTGWQPWGVRCKPFFFGRMKILNKKLKHRFQWTSTISRAKSPAAYYFEKFIQNRSAKDIYLFIHSFLCK